jgi:anti-anti-sigma factor
MTYHDCMVHELPVGDARLAIVTEDRAEAAVVHVFGEVDLANATLLERAIGKAARETNLVIVDFSECRYLDSTTLTVLVKCGKTLGERLRIVVPEKARIARVFAITKLDRVLRIATSVEAASLGDTLQARKQRRWGVER